MTEPSAARLAELLTAHDEDLRAASELDGATDVARIGPLWLGRYAERGFVSYRDLDGAAGTELDDLILAAIVHFAGDPGLTSFEWKTRGHDAPADLDAHLRFAAAVEPHNADLEAYAAQCRARREAQQPTLPAALATERRINPFLRCTEPTVVAAAQARGVTATDTVAVFAALREWKNHF